MNTAPTRPHNIGGSLLSSSDPRILLPIECPFGSLQVRALPDLDTHGLFLTRTAGTILLATHPNGYSCRALAERMAAGSGERVTDQAEYIRHCGGTAIGIELLLAYMSETA